MALNYFADDQGGNRRQRVLQGITGFLSDNTPKLALWLGRQLLLRPYGKRTRHFEQVSPSAELDIDTRQGMAKVHLFGHSGPWIVTSHGWADNSRCFEPLIQTLLQQGYSVAAIDHVAHGRATGKQAHLLAFIEATEKLLAHFQQNHQAVSAIIAHSMGGLASLNLQPQYLTDTKLILIAMPIRLFELMFVQVERMGISAKMLSLVLEHISGQYQTQWQQLQYQHHLHKYRDRLYLIHDTDDKFAPFNHIEDVSREQGMPLYRTQNLGHNKLLRDTGVIQQISSILVGT
ncbi:alpha/beta fold hydrolase [Bowmanella denitrificans]|uniref:Alpha/beta fold hydrolase n=1 Tax=Bowmanella denitrificans TaxID=366582 RepID=A0ABP3GDD9_9ALTE